MSLDRHESLQVLADVLVRMSRATDDELEALIRGLPNEMHGDARELLPAIQHFVDDAPMRRDDEGYREMQQRNLRCLIEALRRDDPQGELLTYDS